VPDLTRIEIAFLFGLIVLNGLFAMSENALISPRKSSLQKFSDASDGAAMAAITLGNDPIKFLATVHGNHHYRDSEWHRL
jgi:putative hemolysin